jgi:hypothetical protein
MVQPADWVVADLAAAYSAAVLAVLAVPIPEAAEVAVMDQIQEPVDPVSLSSVIQHKENI